MKRILNGGSLRMLAIAAIVAVVSGGTVAVAAQMITSKDIKNNTIKLADLSKKVRKKLNRAKVAAGVPGGTGATGATGAAGATGSATYVGPNWGVIDRNTIGDPVADLRAGPAGGVGGSIKPPIGIGSLGIEVGDANTKAAFGDEVDFQGQNVSDLTAVGYRVFTTGENTTAGGAGVNMPSIAFEIDPNLTSPVTDFSTLVWTPAANSASNQWSPYIDATTTGLWGLTGNSTFNNPATQANCGLNGPRCTFAQVQTLLNDGGDPAKIFTAAVTKGRDFPFQGAVDGLRINNQVFDFEPFGVNTTTP